MATTRLGRFQYAILGAGRQGTAAAYDVIKHGEAGHVTFYDNDMGRIRRAIGIAARAARTSGAKVKISYACGDFDGFGYDFHAAVNAMPYHTGVRVASQAISAGVHVCDLGCDTGVVRAQIKLDKDARQAGVAVVPDCGLAPGSSTMFAMWAHEEIRRLGDKPEGIHVYCGGLPRVPVGPLGYKLVFSPAGLLNNYRQRPWVLEDGKVRQAMALHGTPEMIDWDQGTALYAMDTAGGASLLPWRFQKAGLKHFRYQTLRYGGHFEKIQALRDLGLLDDDPVVEEAWAKVISKRLVNDDVKDVVYLRAVGWGRKDQRVQISMMDEAQGPFSAMERTTGFAAGIVANMLAAGRIKAGVRTPDQVIDPYEYVEELRKRGFSITHTST